MGHRKASLAQVSSGFPQTRATTKSAKTENRFTYKDKTHTDTHTCLPLTSPSALKRELFPQPFGPHTRTLVPDLTWREDRFSCGTALQGPAEGRPGAYLKAQLFDQDVPVGRG